MKTNNKELTSDYATELKYNEKLATSFPYNRYISNKLDGSNN